MVDWSVGDYLVMFFAKQYLRKYNRSEAKTLHIGRIWRQLTFIASVHFFCR